MTWRDWEVLVMLSDPSDLNVLVEPWFEGTKYRRLVTTLEMA